MAATRPQAGGTPASADGRLLGQWEWVALPEFGISCMRARLGLEADASLLAIEGLAAVDLEGHPGLRFRIYPLAGDDRTFVLAEAPVAESSKGGRRPTIRTAVTLGDRSWSVELQLVPRRGVSPPLTLGRSALGGLLEVDPDAEALAGLPRIWPEPAGPDADEP